MYPLLAEKVNGDLIILKIKRNLSERIVRGLFRKETIPTVHSFPDSIFVF